MRKTKLREMRSEYGREDLGKGVRGKYVKEYEKRRNLVLLSPDVARYFPSDEAVNEALRSLIHISKNAVEGPAKTTRGPKKSRLK